jgi:hypothetical protein
MATKKVTSLKKSTTSKKTGVSQKTVKTKKPLTKQTTTAPRPSAIKSVKRPPSHISSAAVGAAAVGGAAAAGAVAVAGAPAELGSLQDRLGRLQESLLLNEARQEMGDIESGLSMLPAEVEALRTRGYVFRSFLDQKLRVLAEQWDETRDRVAQEIDRRTRDLEMDASAAESALRQAASGGSAAIGRASSTIDTLEHKVGAAQSAVEALYENVQTNLQQCRTQIEQIRWLLDQVDEATFELYPAEDPVLAVRAQYMKSKKDGPEGVLLVTDERLIFEQKEEVTTKKVLFIATEKEKLQETLFAVTVGQIEEVKTSQKGFLGSKQLLDIVFTSDADLSGVTMRVIGADNDEWAALIGRVRSGEIANERTSPKDETAVEAARKAPTKCTTCGATLDVEIVRGMREIKCDYCGSIIRL